MKIACPACNAKYALPDDRIQGKNKIFKIPCKRCGAEIRVRGVETAEDVGRTTLPFALDLPAQPSAPQPPAQIWFAGIDGKQVGPMAEHEVVEHIQAGRLGPADLIWRKGFSAWTAVKDVSPFDDLVLASPDLPAEAPAAAKRSPRRAQTLELSAAMIELLVKLDGQQSAEAEGPPDLGTVEPPDLPPLDPEPTVVTSTRPASGVHESRVAGDPRAVSGVTALETEVATAPPVEAVASSLPPRPADGRRDTSPKPAVVIKPAAALSAPAQTAPQAEAKADPKPPEPSIKIRLPEETPTNRERTRPSESKAPAAQTGRDNKTDARAGAPIRPEVKSSKPEPRVDVKAPASKAGPVGGAAKGPSAQAKAAAPAVTGSGKSAPEKKKGGSFLGIGLGAGAVAAILAVVVVTNKSPDEAVKVEAPAATAVADSAQPGSGTAQPGSGTAQPGSGTAQPGSGTAQPGSTAEQAAAAQAQASASAPAVPGTAGAEVDAGAAGAAGAALAAEDVLAAPAEAAAAKVEGGVPGAGAADPVAVAAAQAAVDQASAQKAAEDKAAADKALADKALADKAAADAAAAEKAAAERAAADRAAAQKGSLEKSPDKTASAEAKTASAEAKAAAAQAAAQKADEAKAKRAEQDALKRASSEEAKAKKAEQDAARKAAAEEAKQKRAEADAAKKEAAAEAKRKKQEEAERKKAEADAKVAGRKPTVSDDDIDEILKKHDSKKVGSDGPAEGLSQSQVSAVGEKAKKKVANCYLLNADDPIEDTIKVQVLVNSTGQVERATVLGKHGANGGMAKCIADEVKKLLFPTGSGASKKYTLPFRVGG